MKLASIKNLFLVKPKQERNGEPEGREVEQKRRAKWKQEEVVNRNSL